MIDVLVPVLGRPQNVGPLLQSLERASLLPHRLLFLTTPGDRAQLEACEASGQAMLKVTGRHHQYPLKMNAGFQATDAPFVFLASDDIEFQRGWDSLAMQAAEQSGAAVIGLDDMANAHVRKGIWSTHPLVRRSYVMEQGGSLEGPGHLLSTEYDHNYCERELCHLAQFRGLWTFARAARVRHRHPAWGSAAEDGTYRKGRRLFGRDQQIFLRRARGWQCAGLLPVELARSGCR